MIDLRQTAITFALMLVTAIAAVGQRSQQNVSSAFAVLTTSLDSKSVTEGKEFSLKALADVVVDGRIAIPANSIMVGHVSEILSREKENSVVAFALVIDKAVLKDNRELHLQAIIAAVAAPKDQSLASDPTSAMMRSNEPKMTANPSSAASSGELSASSKANSTAAVAAAELKGRMDDLRLNEDSQGAIGFEGLSLSWRLTTSPPVTVFTTKHKRLKLEVGTQMLLRMTPPRLPKYSTIHG